MVEIHILKNSAYKNSVKFKHSVPFFIYIYLYDLALNYIVILCNFKYYFGNTAVNKGFVFG